jgi:RNA polymerase sigma-70 factor, ECF subfamily
MKGQVDDNKRKAQITEDAFLVSEAQRDPQAFSKLYDKYWLPLYRFIFQRIADDDAVKDIAQQVMIKALKNIKSYRSEGFAFSSWLFRIAISEISNAVKKDKTERALRAQTVELEHLNDDLESDQSELRMGLLKAMLDRLSESELELIEMRYFEKRKLKDVAEILEISEGNAKVKMHRIMTKMKNWAQNQ